MMETDKRYKTRQDNNYCFIPKCFETCCYEKCSKPSRNANESSHVNVPAKIDFVRLIDVFAGPVWRSLQALINKNDMNITPENEMKSFSLSYCQKSHHHRGLTAISDLRSEHLPVGYRDHRLKNYVETFANSVVKVSVHATSQERNCDEKYCLPVPNGTRIVRQGSGWVSQVLEDDVPETIPCYNPRCSHSKPHNVIGPIYVMTARHVVYDETEARSAEIVFTDDKPSVNSHPSWIAEGHSIAYTPDTDRDFVYVICYSHDLNIFSHLRSVTGAMTNATMALVDADIESKSNKDFVFIISHPHGYRKHISFGTVEGREETDVEFDAVTGQKLRGRLTYTYDVPTCPGSSGAAVCIMGTDGANYYQFPHSLDKRKGKGVNSGLVDWW